MVHKPFWELLDRAVVLGGLFPATWTNVGCTSFTNVSHVVFMSDDVAPALFDH